MPRAILSVADNTGLRDFARVLHELGWDLVASQETAAYLQEAGLPVTSTEILTGAREMLGSRIRTLHPAIHAGIMASDSDADLAELATLGYAPISLVVCNVVPFQDLARQPGATLDGIMAAIDLDGMALLHAAAMNFSHMTALCDPADYGRVIALLRAAGRVDAATRRSLALKAFAATRDYDTAIHAFLLEQTSDPMLAPDNMPEALSLGLVRTYPLRYGSNPHQLAAFYAPRREDPPLGATILGGQPLSYSLTLAVDLAWQIVQTFEAPAVAIVRYQVPVGIASAPSIAAAFAQALATDRATAPGSAIAINRPLDEQFVTELSDLFVEAIAAPDFSPPAQERLSLSRRNCTLLKMLPVSPQPRLTLRTIRGGILAQTVNRGDPPQAAWRAVTRWKATAEEIDTLRFAWDCVRFVPSCAAVLATPTATVGIAGGLPDRLDVFRLAIDKAGQRARQAVLASDAHLATAEPISLAAAAGITAIVQPGGAVRDAEIITAADEAGIAMIFTGARHLRH